MKKMYITLICFVFILSGCSQKQTEMAKKPPNNIFKMEETASRLYVNLAQEVNRQEMPKAAAEADNNSLDKSRDIEDSNSYNKGKGVAYADESGMQDNTPVEEKQDGDASRENQTNKSGQTKDGQDAVQSTTEKNEDAVNKTLEKSYFSLKELFRLWEEMQVKLVEGGISAEQVTALDETLNQTGYMLNSQNLNGAMESINDSMLVISEILESYDQSGNADMLRMEYYVNEIDICSGNMQEVNNMIQKLRGLLEKLEERETAGYQDKIDSFRMALNSLENATKYSDAQLIKLKTGILRNDVKALKALAGD